MRSEKSWYDDFLPFSPLSPNTLIFINLYIYIPQEYLGKSLYLFMWVLVMELSIGLYNSVYDLSRASIWVIYESLVFIENSSHKDLEKNNYEGFAAATAAKLLQSCPTLCDPLDSSPQGSPVPGILQARTLEWVAMKILDNRIKVGHL